MAGVVGGGVGAAVFAPVGAEGYPEGCGGDEHLGGVVYLVGGALCGIVVGRWEADCGVVFAVVAGGGRSGWVWW